ncbi:MlaC/ttg2D family ABC transporter substrate-binding protein [Azospirillum rugosum]|uniref:Phospholipid transport system substrate-binding protein n=1 Tax=Azospirillum rugosum TaxID=416170 RepID=A0ABS4SLE3_9PROT|nr:ABC transporter substrate-binding protein [Azospirillum rugosum]MBP2293386.1 phospholipid transport system substrate-binding protein [Azospirillum rugosum]
MLIRRQFLAAATFFGAAVWTPAPVGAQSGEAEARTFIQNLGDEAIRTFSDKTLPRQQAIQRFQALLHRGFDVPYIGRWVLGRFWNQATEQQQAEYQRLFERLIINTYAGRFLEYSGETFKVTGARSESGADSTVATQIVRPNGPPINLEWRVRHRDGHPKIIDVVVEGVSMGVTQRQEFASVIQQNGGKVDGLIQALRQKVG